MVSLSIHIIDFPVFPDTLIQLHIHRAITLSRQLSPPSPPPKPSLGEIPFTHRQRFTGKLPTIPLRYAAGLGLGLFSYPILRDVPLIYPFYIYFTRSHLTREVLPCFCTCGATFSTLMPAKSRPIRPMLNLTVTESQRSGFPGNCDRDRRHVHHRLPLPLDQ
jgi:hypothetical protein